MRPRNPHSRAQACWHNGKAYRLKRHREFVLFSDALVLPEYVLAYQRVRREGGLGEQAARSPEDAAAEDAEDTEHAAGHAACVELLRAC